MAEHYYTKKPTSKLVTSTIVAHLRDHDLTFITGSGVFARSGIDRGTEVLIKYCEIKGDEKLLDLGCGYGPVGVSLKRAYPKLEVTCTDVNQRAVMLCKENAKKNKVEIRCKSSDGFEKIKDQFDCILLNPPQTAGKKLCMDLIFESFKHLNSGGNLQIVARHQKGGKGLSEHMEDIFGNVRIIKRKSGFRVYYSEKE